MHTFCSLMPSPIMPQPCVHALAHAGVAYCGAHCARMVLAHACTKYQGARKFRPQFLMVTFSTSSADHLLRMLTVAVCPCFLCPPLQLSLRDTLPRTPGVIARCPPGEYKSGLGAPASCTKCALGVTTLVVTAAGVTADGATKAADCRALLPGYFAKSFGPGGVITEAQQCQPGDYCPGGDTFTTANAAPDNLRKDCPTGTYTDKIGATSVNECSKSMVSQHGICHAMHAA